MKVKLRSYEYVEMERYYDAAGNMNIVVEFFIPREKVHELQKKETK